MTKCTCSSFDMSGIYCVHHNKLYLTCHRLRASSILNYNLFDFFNPKFNYVGTSGLGYPLLLCLGKGLVVILDYIRTAGPLRTGALFT